MKLSNLLYWVRNELRERFPLLRIDMAYDANISIKGFGAEETWKLSVSAYNEAQWVPLVECEERFRQAIEEVSEGQTWTEWGRTYKIGRHVPFPKDYQSYLENCGFFNVRSTAWYCAFKLWEGGALTVYVPTSPDKPVKVSLDSLPPGRDTNLEALKREIERAESVKARINRHLERTEEEGS